jgi:hypothetical protein
VQARVVNLLSRAKSAGDEKRVHCRTVGKSVVGQNREAGLSLDRTHGIGDEEGFKFRVKAASDGEDPVRRRKVNDFYIFKNVDSKPESGNFGGQEVLQRWLRRGAKAAHGPLEV